MTSPNAIEWFCDLPPSVLSTIQGGVFRTFYRGRVFLKCPFDVVLYLQLLQRLSPRTVIEIGTKEGGSALWFADVLSAIGVDARIISIDINLPTPINDEKISFLRGDVMRLGDVLSSFTLAALQRPLLVVEDSAHYYETTLAVLEFFDAHLNSGDYIVIEDGIVQFMQEDLYRRYQNGPNRAIEAFLSKRAGRYEIDRLLCDFYGRNVTFNPNGWLRKT